MQVWMGEASKMRDEKSVKRAKRAETAAALLVLCALFLAGCGRDAEHTVETIEKKDIVEASAVEKTAEDIEETSAIGGTAENTEGEIPEAAATKETPAGIAAEEIEKDYEPKEYMDFPILSTFFRQEGEMGYELVIAKEDESRERDVKVFVSRKEGAGYRLKQVLQDEGHNGDAWDAEGIYLIDVDFDGEKDILVRNGHYGNQGAACYACYLYRQGMYEACESFSNILNASVDAENELILSSWRTSAVTHGWGMYAYVDGSYVLKRAIEQTYLAWDDGDEIQWKIWEDLDKTEEGYPGSENATEEFLESDYDEAVIQDRIYAKGSLWELDDYNRWNSFFQKPEKTNVEETEDEL